MTITLKDFIIECDKEITYMPNIISTLENDTIGILDFFNLQSLSDKKKVVIFTDREKYKNHMLSYVKEFKEWMCADTFDGNINMLEISEAKKVKEHENMDLDYFIKCILHEFTHACQQEWNANATGVKWFWEALATNLSGQDYNPISLDDCDFEKLKSDFNEVKKAYSYSYTIGKYMLENYPRDRIMEYVKNPDILINDSDHIFEEVKYYQANEKNMN